MLRLPLMLFSALSSSVCIFLCLTQQHRDLESSLSRRNTDYDRLHADMTALMKDKADLALQCEKLKLELAAVKDDLSTARLTSSSSSDQLRQKTEELARSEAARATAEALCAELRNTISDAKVCDFDCDCDCDCAVEWLQLCACACLRVFVLTPASLCCITSCTG
jgi:hypothetical protein